MTNNNKEVLRLVAGFRKFRDKYFEQDSIYKEKISGAQSPKTLIIGCSDSRVDPALVTNASPGEIFVVRNVANLVPPYETNEGFHGVSAAIEFAVTDLQVKSVVVLGHRQCGGIRALMEDRPRPHGFVKRWMTIANDAKAEVLAKHGEDADPEVLWREGELRSIVVSLRNLMTFPFVAEAVRDRGLRLHGVYFDLEKGDLCEYDATTGNFSPISV